MFEKLAHRLGLSAIPQIFFISVGIIIVFVGFAIPFNEPFARFFDMLGGFAQLRLTF